MCNVCVVTVTYGNRFSYLRKCISAAFNEGVNKAIIVDNNSDPRSREKLRKYEENNDKIKIIYLNENYGSAGGFKRGMMEAYKDKDCEFIWLLDDDNLPCPGSLKALKKTWKRYKYKNKEKNLVLCSQRSEFSISRKNLEKEKNAFCGFSVSKVLKSYLKKLNIIKNSKSKRFNFIETLATSFSGMFFHKKLLDVVGYPKEELYLYFDDTEWSYRITKNGGKIIIVWDSVVEDSLELGTENEDKKEFLPICKPPNLYRLYYFARNEEYFFRKIYPAKRNKLRYYINMFTFLFIVLIHDIFINHSLIALKTILKAKKDGRKGNLGKNPNFEYQSTKVN